MKQRPTPPFTALTLNLHMEGFLKKNNHSVIVLYFVELAKYLSLRLNFLSHT